MKIDRLLPLILFLFHLTAFGQSKYIGLKGESNVIQGQGNALSQNYWPRIQIIDSTLYVPTTTGIYKKHLNSISDTLWEPGGFSGVEIVDFVKRNSNVIAITNYNNDSLLAFSNDNGSSFDFRDNLHFIDTAFKPSESNTTIHQIAHNVTNVDTVLVAHHFGISLSTDTGKTWTLLTEYAPAYQYRFVDFHPKDKSRLFTAGENGFFNSYLYSSEDFGTTWNMIHSNFNDCVHHIAFHPTDENTYLIGREGRISKTTDAGANWSTIDLSPYIYVYEIQYGESNSNIVYASGGLNGLNDTIYFLRSTDSGDSWNIIHREVAGSGGVGRILSFEILDSGIVYLTDLGGLFYLDLSEDKINGESIHHLPQPFELAPNPFSADVRISSPDLIEAYSLYDMKGGLISSGKPCSREFQLHISDLVGGLYFLSVLIGNEYHTHRLVKH